MEDIRVGEYVRTKDGIIAKVTHGEYIQEYIIKHSKLISEIVEVGD